jgi:hypothetical protein
LNNYIGNKKASAVDIRTSFQRNSDKLTAMKAASHDRLLLMFKKRKAFSNGEELIKPSLQIVAELLENKIIEDKISKTHFHYQLQHNGLKNLRFI